MPLIQVPDKNAIKVLARAVVMLSFTGEGCSSKFTAMAVVRPQVYWPKISVPHHMGLSIGQPTTWQLALLRAREQMDQRGCPRCRLFLEINLRNDTHPLYFLEASH